MVYISGGFVTMTDENYPKRSVNMVFMNFEFYDKIVESVWILNFFGFDNF